MDTKRLHALMLSVCCTVIVCSGFQRTPNDGTSRTGVVSLGELVNALNGAPLAPSYIKNSAPPPVPMRTAVVVSPPGPLSDLANQVPANPKTRVKTMDYWIADIFGLAAPDGKPPTAYRNGDVWDENGRRLIRTIQVCFDRGGAMVLTDGTDSWMRIYLTYPDGVLKKVFDSPRDQEPVEVKNINDEVRAGFAIQVEYWKKRMNAK